MAKTKPKQRTMSNTRFSTFVSNLQKSVMSHSSTATMGLLHVKDRINVVCLFNGKDLTREWQLAVAQKSNYFPGCPLMVDILLPEGHELSSGLYLVQHYIHVRAVNSRVVLRKDVTGMALRVLSMMNMRPRK